MPDFSIMTPDELLTLSDSSAPNSDEAIQVLHIAEIKVQQNQLLLAEKSRELAERQLQASKRANFLTEHLLESNEKARQQDEENAVSMNGATEQLASSTRSLNRATWVLVAFTAVQALIALAALYVSISLKK